MSLKIAIEKNQSQSVKIWFTSDTHYQHAGICRGTTHWRTKNENGDLVIPLSAVRDFDLLDEMNDSIVKNINDVVGPNDILFHLGDWSFGGIENVTLFREKINCKNIHLILGNHDHHIDSDKNQIRKLFNSVNSYLELTISIKSQDSKKDKSHKLVLCHYPIISWNNMLRGSIMLHGHQHLKGESRFGNGKRIDVGMCGHPEFRPYALDEILDLLDGIESYEIENRMGDGFKLIR